MSATEYVVVRTPNGSFVVVECTLDISLELFFNTSLSTRYLESSKGVVTTLRIVSQGLFSVRVLALSSAQTRSQLFFGLCYSLLCSAYWIVACLPEEIHWNCSAYDIEEIQLPHASLREISRPIRYHDTFIQALATAIWCTRSIGWVKQSSAAPATEAWNRWLLEAKNAANQFDATFFEDWDAQKELAKWIEYYDYPDIA